MYEPLLLDRYGQTPLWDAADHHGPLGHAPKGGITSKVNGKFYEGGQFLPDTGLHSGAKKKAKKHANSEGNWAQLEVRKGYKDNQWWVRHNIAGKMHRWIDTERKPFESKEEATAYAKAALEARAEAYKQRKAAPHPTQLIIDGVERKYAILPAIIDRYAGPDQMTLWEEDDHPREPSGTSKGGQFAPKRGPKGGEKINRNTIWGKLRLKGTSEDHTECENCGRKDLKKTVVYEQVDDDGNGMGEYCYFGTECASKVTGTSGGGKKIKRDAIEADYREKMGKKRDDDRMLRVKDSKHDALKVAGGTNRFSGDRFGNGIWMTDGKQWVRADKADPKDIPFFESQGFATKSFEELTKERKTSESNDSDKVPMRQAKAGGEYSDITGKWYKGGHWMPVHGAHSGQEKKPKIDAAASESGSPSANEGGPKSKPEARKKDAYQAEEDRERQARRRNWDEILAGPIGKSLHLGDRPHAIRRLSVSGRLKTWHEQAESVGDAWMKAAADKAREIALRDAGSPDDKEWLTDDVENHQVPDAYNYYANAKQKKLAKQFPNVERLRNWLQYIDSDLEDALLEITRSANETSKTAKYVTIAYAVHRYVSKAQADAGNYKMRHERLHGLAISIETPKGKRRRPEWPPMPCDYGYIKRTKGRDGDHVDVFIGPNKQSELVVVVDQVDQSGKFDEHKCLLGFDTTQKAIDCYLSAYTKGWNLGPVTTMTIGQFKNWLSKGSQRSQLSQQVSRYAQGYAARYAARNDSDDLWFADSSEIDRYDWQNQPRAPKGVANGGQWIGGDGSAAANPSSAGLRSAFNRIQGRTGTKSPEAPKPKQPRKKMLPELPGSTPGAGVKRELAERPRIGPEHELHYSNLPQEWKDKVLKWHWDMHEIAWPMQKIDQSLTEEQNAARGWPMVDKDKLRGKLEEMNAMNREAEAQGIKLHEYVNASGLINRHIAARLDGGSRFFDPEKLGTRILKPVSQPLSPEHAEQAYNPQPDQGKPDLKNAVVDAFRKADAATRREMKRDPEQLKAIEEGMGLGRKAPTPTPTPTPEASAEPDTPAWHPQSAADMSKRASGSLDRAVKDAVGSDPGKVEYFKDLAKQAWQQQTNEAQEHNEMIRTIAGFFNKSQGNRVIAGKDGAKGRKIAVKDPGVGGLVNWARAGRGDVDKNRFDELTEFATRTYPQIQNEDDLRATLAEGIKTLPRPHDDAVIEQAMGMVGPGFFDEEPAATEEANEDAWETIPFSVRSELLHAISRYWFEKKPERYQFCA